MKVTKNPAYSAYQNAKTRCYNKNRPTWKDYGGRGIKMCDSWLKDPKKFLRWAQKNGYKKGLQLDRKNTNGNYSPINCRFVTPSVNCANTRLISKNNTSGFRGVTKHPRPKGIFWRARIANEGNIKSLGVFKTPEEAARAYDNFIIKNNTEHPLNFKN
mgnify:CR=1 FL=1